MSVHVTAANHAIMTEMHHGSSSSSMLSAVLCYLTATLLVVTAQALRWLVLLCLHIYLARSIAKVCYTVALIHEFSRTSVSCFAITRDITRNGIKVCIADLSQGMTVLQESGT